MSNRPPSEAPKDIAVRKGVVVGKAGQRDLLGDLYAPAAAGEERAGIVVVHGGGWRRGKPEGVRGFGERLAQAGFVCLLVAYRLTPEAIWPAQIEDVKCAIRFLRAHAGSLDVAPDRIGILGDSAGGQLALMAGVSSTGFEGKGGHGGCSSAVAAVAAMYGPARIRFKDARPNHRALMGTDASAADYERASPIAYDLTRFPPCLLIHGMEDAAVPVADTIAFRDQLARLGRPVSMHLFAGEGHAFDRKTAEGGPRMVSVADPRSVYGGAVVGLITLFFRKYLARDAVAGVARKEARCLSLA